jgi:hypothetical protein
MKKKDLQNKKHIFKKINLSKKPYFLRMKNELNFKLKQKKND